MFLFRGLTHRFAHAYIGAVTHFVRTAPTKSPPVIDEGTQNIRGTTQLRKKIFLASLR